MSAHEPLGTAGPAEVPVTGVAICTPTFRRNDALGGLLSALVDLELPSIEVSLVVVDNDPEGRAREVVAGIADRLPFPARYVHEPRPGISAARNAAVAAATGARFVAFIDDDELPERTWLRELLRAQREHQADVVAGWVRPRFTTYAPAWAVEGRFFERVRYPEGHRLRWCATNNCLVERSLFSRIGGFDNSFGLTGGEDSQLFLRATEAGARIVFCGQAVVDELVDPARVKVAWLLRRSFREGCTRSRIEQDVLGGRRIVLTRVSRAVALLTFGAARVLEGVARRDRVVMITGARSAAEAVGMFGGLLHYRPQFYGDRPSVRSRRP